jgi:CRP-like cAMP-binding protein
VEPTSALLLHRNDFLRIASARAELGLALARHLCSLLRSTNYQMESIALYELRVRVARFLRLTLCEQHGAELPAEPELRLGISQGDLAALLGASRPKINKVLQQMHAEGMLRRDGDRLICNRAKLDGLLAVNGGYLD